MNDLAILAGRAHAAARRYRNAVIRRRQLTGAECEAVQASVERVQEVLEAALLHAERVAPPEEEAGEA